MNESELDTHDYPPEVVWQITQENADSYVRAAKSINQQALETIVIVQHEYGIFGGNWGNLLVEFLKMLRCPVITTLHTVLADPSQEMRNVTEQIIAKSDRLIVLTNSSYKLFNELYPSALNKVAIIKHGIHPLHYKPSEVMKPQFDLTNRSVLLTFGLLSRNKGIEYIISSLPLVIQQVPDIIYLIVGATHPGVLRKEAETYRLELKKLVNDLSLQQHVRFIDDYLPLQAILDYLQATDIYVATSLDPQQAVSGTLSYALGAGRAVIATSFSQAKEVVSSRVGRIVAMRDSTTVSAAVIELFSEPKLLQAMNQTAYAQTRSMLWSNVADDYASCIADIALESDMIMIRRPKLNWKHLEALTDKFGLLQFSRGALPDPASGYTLDDNSRALQIVNYAFAGKLLNAKRHAELSRKYLQIMSKCLSQSPTVNYLSATTQLAHKQNLEENLSDSLARAYYGLQTAVYIGSPASRRVAVDLLDKLPANLRDIPYIRSRAQLLLGATLALDHGDDSKRQLVDELSSGLISAYHENSTTRWKWFDKTMTYANGQLCASLLEAARTTNSVDYRLVGLESLKFLCQTCFMGDVYVPIGQADWYRRGGRRSLFDQQPEDAFSMMQALDSAYKLTGSHIYIKRAQKVFSWFMGNNLIGARVYDDQSGGCHDGLIPLGVNPNEGAESTLSYLGSRLIMEKLSSQV